MRILFVCTGNSFRSPVAEALARKYTEHEAESAGTSAADRIAENGRELLEREGAEKYLKPEPESVSQEALDRADKVVAMTDHHREFLLDRFELEDEKVVSWGVEDPIKPGVEPEESFKELKEKVKKL